MPMSPEDIEALREAKRLLEHPGLAARIALKLGTSIEKGYALLPARWQTKVGRITQQALTKAVRGAILTIDDAPGKPPAPTWHKIAVAASGGLGGFFGLAALAVELPVSTAIMLRAVADIARSQGESLRAADTQMACLEVLALGGAPGDSAETGYFAIRAALAQSVAKAATHVAQRGLAADGAPALVRLIVQIAQRFSLQVSEKLAAQALPAIGAAGGALINTLFIDHYQDLARGHFCVRRLERRYGAEVVQTTYAML
jgi:hypothetical protein